MNPSVGVVAYVDFKLISSRKDGNRVQRKVESSSSEAKTVRIGEKGRKIFRTRPERGTNGPSFALEGK